MRILAVETLSRDFSIALYNDNKCRCILGKEVVESLFPSIEKLILEMDVPYNALDMIVLIHGPGSFTAIRAAIAALQGITAFCALPIYGVTLFEVCAFKATRENDAKFEHILEILLVIAGYREDLVYMQLFDKLLILPKSEAQVLSRDEFWDKALEKHKGYIFYESKITAQDIIDLVLFRIKNKSLNLLCKDPKPLYMI